MELNSTNVIVGIVIVVLCLIMIRIGSGRPVKPTFVLRYKQGDYESDALPPERVRENEMRLRSPRLFYGTGHDAEELWGGSDGNMNAQERRDAGFRSAE